MGTLALSDALSIDQVELAISQLSRGLGLVDVWKDNKL